MNQHSRRQFLWYGSAALGESLLKDCTSPQTSTPNPAPSATARLKAAIVLPGIITDNAWNQAGYEGLTAAKKLGVETAYVEKVGQSDQAEVLSDFARRGFNLVYAHGGQCDAAIGSVLDLWIKT